MGTSKNVLLPPYMYVDTNLFLHNLLLTYGRKVFCEPVSV